MELSNLYLKELPVKNSMNDVKLSLKIVFLPKQTVQTLMIICLGLHCLPKYMYLFTDTWNENGYGDRVHKRLGFTKQLVAEQKNALL